MLRPPYQNLSAAAHLGIVLIMLAIRVRPPYQNLSAAAQEKLVATGFLRMAPDGTAAEGAVAIQARNQCVADTIQIVSTALLGLTVGCAQCHNHRHDPISQVDYYRFRAIFEPALNTDSRWRVYFERRLDRRRTAKGATTPSRGGPALCRGGAEKRRARCPDLLDRAGGFVVRSVPGIAAAELSK